MDELTILRLSIGGAYIIVLVIMTLIVFNKKAIGEWDKRFLAFFKKKGLLDEELGEIPKATYSIVKTVMGQVIEEQTFGVSGKTTEEALNGIVFLKSLHEGTLKLVNTGQDKKTKNGKPKTA